MRSIHSHSKCTTSRNWMFLFERFVYLHVGRTVSLFAKNFSLCAFRLTLWFNLIPDLVTYNFWHHRCAVRWNRVYHTFRWEIHDSTKSTICAVRLRVCIKFCGSTQMNTISRHFTALHRRCCHSVESFLYSNVTASLFLIKFYYCKWFSLRSCAILARLHYFQFEHRAHSSLLWCSFHENCISPEANRLKKFFRSSTTKLLCRLKQWNAFTKLLPTFGLISFCSASNNGICPLSVSISIRW